MNGTERRGRKVATWTGGVLLVAAAYFVSGRLGLLLALPPGFSTAVWPPSGIALGVLLLLGRRYWLGVCVGSFLVNLSISLDLSSGEAITRSTLLAAGIGAGAGLQAVIGASLLRSARCWPGHLQRELEIGKFLLLGGPVSCLVNSILGVTLLVLAGAIPLSEFPFNWFTWWVGDTVGVLVFTPLVILAFARPREIWRSRLTTVGLPLAATFVAAVSAFCVASAAEFKQRRLDFERRSDRIVRTIQEELRLDVEILHAVERLVAASEWVSPTEFETFVSRTFSLHPGILAIEWVPRVTGDGLALHQEKIRSLGYTDYTVTELSSEGELVPASARSEYFPVCYVEPYERNKAAHGFDLVSDPVRRAALRRSCDRAEDVATEPITLVQSGGEDYGCLIFLPAYKNGIDPGSVALRREELKGYALAVFRISAMLRGTLAKLERHGVAVRITDDSSSDGKILLEDENYAEDPAEWGRPRAKRELLMSGRRWTVHLSPTLDYFAKRRTTTPWFVLAGGLLFTSLLGFFLLVLTGRVSKIEKLVGERTETLSQVNESLRAEIEERKRVQEELRRRAFDLQHARNRAEAAEEKLTETVAELRRSNQELDDFAYVASHDLKEPLRGIRNYATFLLEDYEDVLDDDGRSKLRVLPRLTQRLESLIDSLLEFSRFGKTTQSIKECDLSGVLSEVIDSLKISLDEQEVDVRIPRPLPTTRCDSARIGEVFRNLITNAMKYNDKPEKWIEIGWTDDTEEAGAVALESGPCFYVRDNGIGIKEEHLDRVFKIFKRLHKRDAYGGGTGAGLTIVKKIVELHGGSIRIESTYGEGTTFYFTLGNKNMVSDTKEVADRSTIALVEL